MSGKEYSHITTFDFRLNTGCHQEHDFHVLSLPESWYSILQRVPANTGQRDFRYPPVRSLHTAIQLLHPDLLCILPWNRVQPGKPWLYSRKASLPIDRLVSLLDAWYNTVAEGEPKLDTRLLPRTFRDRQDHDPIGWQKHGADLVPCQLSDNGTVRPDTAHYQLVPSMVCRWISEETGILDIGGEPVRFLFAHNHDGPELISWPPRLDSLANSSDRWRWSFVIRPVLHTSPVHPEAILRINFSTRRWVSGHIDWWTKSSSAYLERRTPWVDGVPNPTSLTSVRLQVSTPWGRSINPRWQYRSDSILARMGVSDFPQPDDVFSDFQAAMDVGDTRVGVTYHEMMSPNHEVHNGIPVRDRSALYEQVQDRLAPHGIEPLAQVSKSPLRLDRKAPLIARQGERDPTLLREALADTTGGNLRIEIAYDDERVRNALIGETEKLLGAGPNTAGMGDHRTYHLPGLIVDILCKQMSAIFSPIRGENGEYITNRNQLDSKKRRRADDIAKQFNDVFGATTEPVATFVELRDWSKAGYYDRLADPKNAIRVGLAKANRYSQFIDHYDRKLPHRAQSSLLDILRQSGAVPGHIEDHLRKTGSSRPGIPEDIQVIAGWCHSDRNHRGKALPIIVKMDTEHGIQVAFADTNEWISYPKALMKAATRSDSLWVKSSRSQSEIPRVIRDKLLFCSQFGPALLIFRAQNTRHHWTWAQDVSITRNKVRWNSDGELVTPPPTVRIARMRDNDRLEVPQHFAASGERVGNTSGLFARFNDRTFLSLHEKTPNMQFRTGKSKIEDPWHQAAMPAVEEIFLPVLQPGDDPEQWAFFVHAMRHMSPHYDHALQMPMPLHYARQVSEYIIDLAQHDEDDDEE